MTLQELNGHFGINGRVAFTAGCGGWPYAELNGDHGRAVVSLYGAHVLHYIPRGGQDVLWNTEKAVFETGKPIRGGVPVCWPWFGPHATDPGKPMHGFVRLSLWNVQDTAAGEDGEVRLILATSDSDQTRGLWPHPFSLTLAVVLGRRLAIELVMTNPGDAPFSCTDALHSYIRVGEASRIAIEGLQGGAYYDWLDNSALKRQEEALLTIRQEQNRRYIDSPSDCIVDDPVLKRMIRVAKVGSTTTVVWNPWEKTARTIPDMGAEDYRTMVCIEAANAYNDGVILLPGQTHRLATMLSIE
jgi:glucose-6-phosphate 1-epimerase